MTAIDPEIATPSPSPRAAATALLGGFTLLMVANALQGTTVGVRSELEGFADLWTSFIMTAYFAGFLVGSQLAGDYLGKVGHIRTYAALSSLMSATAVLHPLAPEPLLWLVLRFISGLCMAGVYVVVESWLNDIANQSGGAIRGRLMAIYMVLTMGAFTFGQFVFNIGDPSGFTLFVVASVLASVSLIPTAVSTTSAPVVAVPEPMSVRDLARVVPTGVVGAFLVGLTTGGLLGLSAVYGARVGLTGDDLAAFVAAPMAGAVIGQWPIGSLSDRIHRRTVLFWAALASTALFALLTQVDPATPLAIVLLVAVGATYFPLYSVTLAYVNDWIPANQMLGASVSFVRINGIGAFLGPLVVSAAMGVAGLASYFAVLAASTACIAAYVAYRMAVREAMPTDRQSRWVPAASRGGALAASVLTAPVRRRPGNGNRRTQRPDEGATDGDHEGRRRLIRR